jgi:hypothetical protein
VSRKGDGQQQGSVTDGWPQTFQLFKSLGMAFSRAAQSL